MTSMCGRLSVASGTGRILHRATPLCHARCQS
jgi:hypothetical protein